MIFVGIDVAKDKHDCFILNSEGTVLADVFTIANNRIGFETLLSRIQSCSQGESKIKVGLEATGHYSYNLLGFLLDSGLATYVINPLHTNLYRKSLSLRRTKTDRIDARTIAMMLMSDAGLSPSTYQSGQLQNCYAHMEKRGSRYLRYALFNAAKYVCLWCPTFSAYLEKKTRSKATLTLRAMLARRYGFGASPNKPPLCHLWPQRHCLPLSDSP